MRKIVKEILEAETRVGAILQEARRAATEIRDGAGREASQKIAEAKDQAREIVQAALEEANREAEQIRRERLHQAEQRGQTLLEAQAKTIEDLVDRICGVILTTDCRVGDR